MALEFELYLQTSLNPEEVVNLILKKTDFHKSDNERGDDGSFYAAGFVAWVYLMKNSSQEIVRDEFGVETNLSILFWHRNSEYKIGLGNILKSTMIVLQNTTDDAVFVNVMGGVNLFRKNNKLMLNPTSFFNDEDAMWRFKDVPFSNYEIKNLQFSA